MKKRIALPMLPHLKKWLQKKYSIGDFFQVDSRTVPGIVLLSLVRLKGTKYQPEDKYSEVLHLEFAVKNSKSEIRQSFVISANLYFNKLFQDEMFTYTRALMKEGVPAFRSLQAYLESYGIEDGEFQKESAHRAWMRHNEMIRNKEKCTVLS